VGLYVALWTYPPHVAEEIATAESSPAKVTEKKEMDTKKPSRAPETTPRNRKSRRRPRATTPGEPNDSTEALDRGGPRLLKRTPAHPRSFTEGRKKRRPGAAGKRSSAFRNARRAIIREGVEPDWDQFEGRERQMLERAWERYERRKKRTGEREGFEND